MTVRIVLLSGPLAVGKTAVAAALIEQFGFKKVSSSGFLRTLATDRALPDTRETLRQLGDSLDEVPGFSWLVNDVAVPQVDAEKLQLDWFVDAVRKAEQVAHFRNRFGDVLHVHFTATEEVLKARFVARDRDGDDVGIPGSYEKFISHPNERSARSLIGIADLVIDLHKVEAIEAAAVISNYERRAPGCTA